MKPVSGDQLDARTRNLLRLLIAQYLADGQPVGSRTLARTSGLQVSAATVRNIMSDLEDLGLLASPHTSAGRIPTAQGLRLFVDSLIELKPVPRSERMLLEQQLLPQAANARDLVDGVSSLLSAVTHFVGVVTVPRETDFPVRHIDFVHLSGQRILVILVFADNQVQNRVISVKREYAASELEQAANYLNAEFSGLHIDVIRRRLLRELREAGSELNRLLSATVEVAASAFGESDEGDVLVRGQTNLMGYQELSDLDRLRELFEAFQRKRDLLVLLESCASAQGVRLFIGEESGFAPLDGCSLVGASYGADGRVLGTLGVIGPKRMAYDRVIPVVQATAELLSDALNRVVAAQ